MICVKNALVSNLKSVWPETFKNNKFVMVRVLHTVGIETKVT